MRLHEEEKEARPAGRSFTSGSVRASGRVEQAAVVLSSVVAQQRNELGKSPQCCCSEGMLIFTSFMTPRGVLQIRRCPDDGSEMLGVPETQHQELMAPSVFHRAGRATSTGGHHQRSGLTPSLADHRYLQRQYSRAAAGTNAPSPRWPDTCPHRPPVHPTTTRQRHST